MRDAVNINPLQRQIQMNQQIQPRNTRNTNTSVVQVWLQPASPPLRSQPSDHLESTSLSAGFFILDFLCLFCIAKILPPPQGVLQIMAINTLNVSNVITS